MTRDEFELILTKYEKEVYSICIRLAGSREEADELFQDTWLSAMEEVENIDFYRNPRSYMIGKVIFIWKGKKRKYARRQRIAPQVDGTEILEQMIQTNAGSSPELMIEKQEIEQVLRNEVKQMKEKYRTVIELYYALDLSAAEISTILKIPQGTVESRLYKARKILKTRMEDQGYEI